MHHRLYRLAAALALGLPLLAIAQGRADPADRKTAPALPHHSAFSDYQAFRDIPLGDWRGLNDTVGRAALKSSAVPTEHSAPPAAPAASATKATTPMSPMQHMPSHHQHMPGGRR